MHLRRCAQLAGHAVACKGADKRVAELLCAVTKSTRGEARKAEGSRASSQREHNDSYGVSD
eukprot:6195235-Pleurochrysis_carterae.AAC.2